MGHILKFQWSAELFKDSDQAHLRTARAVERYLNERFIRSQQLSELPIVVRYVPIIMPQGMRERYPARSKLRKKERLYDCAPQLDYDTFVTGTFEQQIDEYVRGLFESVAHLQKLGATQEQADEFVALLANAKQVILAESLDQTRH